MNLFSRHLTGLFDFAGRENRQPFWLWVLMTYGFQMIVGIIVMIPLMMSYFQALRPIMDKDPAYLDAHPEVVQQLMMQAMVPMMSGMMVFTAIMALSFVLLLVAATVRRLHDSNRSGWWSAPVFVMQIAMPIIYAIVFPSLFETIGSIRPGTSPADAEAAMLPLMQTMSLISLAGTLGLVLMIALIVFLALPGTPGPNRFGEDPLPGLPDFQRFQS